MFKSIITAQSFSTKNTASTIIKRIYPLISTNQNTEQETKLMNISLAKIPNTNYITIVLDRSQASRCTIPPASLYEKCFPK